MLRQDKTARYLFVTNESVEAGLQPYRNHELLDFQEPGALPPHTRMGTPDAEAAELGRRIGICDKVSSEVLGGRIRRLLEKHGNVPPQNVADCVEDLRAAIRERMAGGHEGILTTINLVSILTDHDGARLAHRSHDRYVPPASYQAIKAALRDRHAVIIVGPSGTGKSLTADVLAADYGRSDLPYLERSAQDPADARSALTEPGPLLVHLKDPWGDAVETPEAGSWTSQLPKLFAMADSGHKFLVTSRRDIFERSRPGPALCSYTIAVDVDDYGPEQLTLIYDNHMSELAGHARSLAVRHRGAALDSLERPYEIERFLQALTRESSAEPRHVYAIISDARIEAIATVIREQAVGWGPDGIASSAWIWGLLGSREAIGLAQLRELARSMRRAGKQPPNIEGFIYFLAAGRNLRIDQDGRVSLQHPRVLQGLALALQTSRSETEGLLTDLTETLLRIDGGENGWALDAALGIVRGARRLPNIVILLEPGSQQLLELELLRLASDPAEAAPIKRAFDELIRYSAPDFPPRRFVEMLMQTPPRDGWVQEPWRRPRLGADEVAELVRGPTTAPLLRNFVRRIMPFVDKRYDEVFLEFVAELGFEMGAAFGEAIAEIAGNQAPAYSIRTIVAGALRWWPPGYDGIIQAFIDGEEATDRWMARTAEERRRAEEHEVDAILVGRILEEPGERYYSASEGLQAVAMLRVHAEGWAWLDGHPNASVLVRSLATALLDGEDAVPPRDIEILLRHADAHGVADAWRLAAKNWSADLRTTMVDTLVNPYITNPGARAELARVAMLASSQEGAGFFREIAARMAAVRRIEFAQELHRTADRKTDPTRMHASAFVAALAADERTISTLILAVDRNTDVVDLMKDCDAAIKDRLSAMLRETRTDLARVLVRLVATCDGELLPVAETLIDSGDVDDAISALVALDIRGGIEGRRLITKCLEHARYPVRRAAMQYLVEKAEPSDRPRILGMCTDRSADVRLAWAEMMGQLLWPEAETSLVRLLADERDFSLDRAYNYKSGWPRFMVARAAARALGAYKELRPETIGVLVESRYCEDPFVHFWAIQTLAKRNEPPVLPFLREAFDQPKMNGNPGYRPAAQSALWGYFDRMLIAASLEQEDIRILTRTALEEPAWASGPALITLGARGGEERDGLLAALLDRGLMERAELLQVAAALSGVPVGGHPRAEALRDLSEAKQNDAPNPAIPTGLSEWAISLGGTDVASLTCWLVEESTGIPAHRPEEDPRAPRVPGIIPVINMISMSPFAEECPAADDGY